MIKKSVLYIIDKLPVGGAERVFLDILLLMQGKLNYDVCLITGGGELESEIPLGVTVHRLNRKFKFSISSILKARRLFSKYDILHVHMRHNFKYVFFVQVIMFFRVKTVFHDHFGGIKPKYLFLPFPFSRSFRPAVYIGVSQHLTDWAVTKWYINEKDCYTLINLLNLKFNFKIKEKNNDIIKSGIVILGNIKPIKNQILGLEIANLLDTEVTLIGNNQDENYFNKIMSFPSKNKVTILQGISEPYNHLVDFKLGLCTSISESGPLVLLEYLMCGLPFLAFNTGGISAILSDFFPEYFINNHNPPDWANKILTIQRYFSIIDVEKVNKVIRMHFDNETYRSRLLEIYEKT